MASRSWTTSFARFTSAAAVLGALVFVGDASTRHQDAEACGGFGPTIFDVTTFDPAIAGEVDGLTWEPMMHGFGGLCPECSKDAMLADWTGYLKEAVSQADWAKVLFDASDADLAAIQQRLAKGGPVPKGYEKSSLWAVPAAKPKLADAVAFVALARAVEPEATLETGGTARPPQALIAAAQLGMKSARDPFLAQRYGLQLLRLTFYGRDWKGAVGFFDKNAVALSGPSKDIGARAHYYLAGALKRSGNLARANLEFAYVNGTSRALAGAAAEDFQPMDEKDWRDALRLAKTPAEKARLWRLVGITKKDGLTAIDEIYKIDPKSDMFALLLVREVAQAEATMMDLYGEAPTPKVVAAQKASYARIEKIAAKLAATPGADRPWIPTLVLGHLAAKRGDVATAREKMKAAIAMRPGDKAVASQARASLSLALALDWRIDPAREDEVARAMNDIDKDFGRKAAVTEDVRGKLAKAYFAAGKIVDAELLHDGTVDPTDDWGNPTNPKAKQHWADLGFVKDVVARTSKLATNFDRFVVGGSSLSKDQLQKELALRMVFEGDPAGALAILQHAKPDGDTLHVDPFVIHIRDCHDCDQEKFDKAPWNRVNTVQRLVELQKAAGGKGQAAADAAFALGNAYYNITYWGNARTFTMDTHQKTKDTRVAQRWYKQAYDLGTNREFKAKAAWMAAKAELGFLMWHDVPDPKTGDMPGLPQAKQWFAVEKQYKDTKIYAEALRDCGLFADFLAGKK